MKKAHISHLSLTLAAACCLICSAIAADNKLSPAMTGNWNGQAKIIVAWCKQDKLPLKLTINGDRTVTGTIGDATLKDGKLARNRGWIGRKLNIKTDYVITGRLEGEIVAAEKISRSSVSIPLNFQNGSFTGGLHTSGSKLGGKKAMKLSASGLKLDRSSGSKP